MGTITITAVIVFLMSFLSISLLQKEVYDKESDDACFLSSLKITLILNLVFFIATILVVWINPKSLVLGLLAIVLYLFLFFSLDWTRDVKKTRNEYLMINTVILFLLLVFLPAKFAPTVVSGLAGSALGLPTIYLWNLKRRMRKIKFTTPHDYYHSSFFEQFTQALSKKHD